MQYIVKINSHSSLICGTSISESKLYDIIMEIAYRSLESSFFSVLTVHLDLIIVTETIHKGKHKMLSTGIDQHIYVRQKGTHLLNMFCSGPEIWCSNVFVRSSYWQAQYWLCRMLNNLEIPWGLFDYHDSFFAIKLMHDQLWIKPSISTYVHVIISLNSLKSSRSVCFISSDKLILIKIGWASFLLLQD